MSIWIPRLGGALALAAGLALTAQSTTAQGRSDQPRAGAVADVALTGCLEPWTSNAPASPTGAPAEPPPAGVEFVLTGVEETATPPGSATRGDTDTSQYLLLPGSTVDYAAHVNQTVRIVGTIAPQPSPGASPADHAIDPGSRETNLPERPIPSPYRVNLVEVATLTTVAPTCTR